MHQYFIYCRKSTEDDDHQALSLESQHRELLRLAEAQCLSIVDILFERRRARTPGRPVFTRMLQRITKGEAHGILAWHPDRLVRNAVDGGQIINLLAQPRSRKAVFLHSDFWHGWQLSRWEETLPSDFWKVKLKTNRPRDAKVIRALKARGWKVLVIWEHQITRSADSTIAAIIDFLRN
jgi:hypothetical protein